MSIKGGSYTRLKRAIEVGNPTLVRGAAAELDRPLSLADALAVTLVLQADARTRFERAAARWAARLSLETRGVDLADAQLAHAALAQIAAGERDPAVEALSGLLRAHGLHECDRELLAWRSRAAARAAAPQRASSTSPS